MAKKKNTDEEEEEFEDDTVEEETATCRICENDFELGEGDDMILVCEECVDKKKIDVDKIWKDYDNGKISDDELTTFDVSNYMK